MSRSRNRSNLPVRAAELAVAAPLVITHRLARIAAAGHAPSARDRAEMMRMGTEKVAAFHESWFAIGLGLWRAQQQIAWSMWRAAWWPWAGVRMPDASRLAVGLLGSAMAPVHRRALANAKRLGRTRR